MAENYWIRDIQATGNLKPDNLLERRHETYKVNYFFVWF